ncbi:MAG: hypothetical protein AB7P02_10105 [Alphaproteobacteria bacterium]
MTCTFVRRALLASVLSAGLAACDQGSTPVAQGPGPAAVERTAETSAIVQSVDLQARRVVLRDASDRLLTVIAGPDVRNLAQVRAGDRVVIHYREALAVSMAVPGSPPVSGIAAGTVRAEPGQTPAGAEGVAVQARVRIEAVDPVLHTVTFVGPAGVPRTIRARDPRMQEFVRGLKRGDEVDVTYAEAIAVRVDPMGR